ncbi:MAG: dephospho-CoA kinase [Thermoleophilaceae bacterium]|nr:dephospho-CoA kinase [Thermoleophilaceae bacterium]
MAAGKSEALAALRRLGAETLSTDAVVHELLGEPELRDLIVDRLGPGVLQDGALDRGAVGQAVFGSDADRSWLEQTLWPRVGARVAAWYGALPEGTVAVVETPLLFEAGMETACDATIAVIASDEIRAERAGARGHAALAEREARQQPQDEKARRADHVVVNDGTVEELEAAMAAVLARLA